jgi:hypothetical protein
MLKILKPTNYLGIPILEVVDVKSENINIYFRDGLNVML